MKTKLLKTSILTSALFVLSITLFAQDFKSSQSNIIATTHLDTSSTTIVSFNYLNNSWDTLFTVNDNKVGSGFFSTYDSYHRKYFYYAVNRINDTTFTQSFYSLDLYTQQIDSLFTIDSTPAHDMLYDIYRNELLIRVDEAILNYNLTTNSWDSLMTIPHSNQTYTSYAHFYNFIQQKYTYRRCTPINSWVSINLKESLTDSIINDTMINNLFPPAQIKFDYKSGLFFGIASESISQNKYFVSIGNNPNYTSIICNLPSDYNGKLNTQKACFDSERGLYLLPYYTLSQTSELAIFDINSNSVNTTSFSALTNNHHLDNFPDPIIRLEDSLLISNWFSNYTWYLNGNAIPQSDSQTFKPISTGWYNVSTTRPDNSIAFSDSIYVAFVNIDNPNEEAFSIMLFPNPVVDFITIQTDFSPNLNSVLSIITPDGQEIIQKEITKNEMKVNLSSLPKGFYILQIKNENVITINKIIKQ